MARSKALLVIGKEMRVLLRDRRLVLGIVLGGLVIFPLLMTLVGSFQQGGEDQVTVVLYRADERLRAATGRLDGVRVVEVESADPVDLNAPHVSAGLGEGRYWIQAARGAPGHWTVARALESELLAAREGEVEASLRERGVDPGVLRPFSVDVYDPRNGSGGSAGALAALIPYLAIILLVSNAIRATYIAVGEKEHNTLASLLVSSVPRSSIVLGKSVAVMAVAVSASLLLVIGMVLFSSLGLMPGPVPAEGGIRLSPAQVGQVTINLTALSLLISGAVMAIGTFARSQREAGFYTAPLLFLCIFLSIFSFSYGVFAPWVHAIPVLGNALAMKESLLGNPAWALTGLAVVGNLVLFVVLVRACVGMYGRETILFRP
jgi:sodium transport system permease protein